VAKRELRKLDLAGLMSGSGNCPGTSIPSGKYSDDAPYIDAGDTSGDNDTVSIVGWAYWDAVQVPGSDEIYSFTIVGRDANPFIQIKSTVETYRPATYVLDVCPAGTGNWIEPNRGIVFAPDPRSEIIFDTRYLPANRRLYLFVDSLSETVAGTYTLRLKDVTIARSQRNNFDFDGNGQADNVVWRPSEGRWYIYNYYNGIQQINWGLNGDRPVPADYDGDGITDVAVFRPSNSKWYRINSYDGSMVEIAWGIAGDRPVPSDYNDDGRTDLAVWRPSEGRWYIQTDQSLYSVNWGLNGDIPVPGFYFDDDGSADLAVFRNGEWWLLDPNSGQIRKVDWGLTGDIPVPADYDGDGRTDIAVWRPSNGRWYFQFSGSGDWEEVAWGLKGDVPVPSDYDGDGKYDIAVWRPSEGKWYIAPWASGPTTASWGLAGDIPAQALIRAN
jgi:hypothetical protein